MILYGTGQTRSFRVLWALEEAGIAYEYKNIKPGSEDTTSEEYRKLNFQGKIPTLVDGDLVITESAAILNYVATQKQDKALLPFDDAHLRAKYDEISFFVLSDLEQPLWSNGKHRFALPPKQRIPQMLETANWEFAKAEKALIKHLGNSQYIVGDRFTMADILVAHTIQWANHFKFEVEDSLLKYRDHMYKRTACQRALEISSKANQ